MDTATCVFVYTVVGRGISRELTLLAEHAEGSGLARGESPELCIIGKCPTNQPTGTSSHKCSGPALDEDHTWQFLEVIR